MKSKDQTEVATLRTLAPRSKLWFGQYSGMTVEQVLALGHTRYLRNIYYSVAGFSYQPESLRQMGVREEDEIPKPGVDRGLRDRRNAAKHAASRYSAERAGDGTTTAAFQAYIQRKKDYKSFLREDARRFSKGSLARLNHGHK
jgi:hypothetical protein